MAKQLVTLGLLTDIDRAALAAYCSAWERWVEAEEQVRKFGAVVRVGVGSDKGAGYPMQNPYLTISQNAVRQMKAFLTEFGMTPSSRTRIQVDPPMPAGSSTTAAKKSAEDFLFGDRRRA